MQGPLYSPVEMGNTPAQLLSTLNANPSYVALFEQAFGLTPIALDQVYTAITAFESSLISLNSRYDLYAHGYHEALDEEEIAGSQCVSFIRCPLRRMPHTSALH